MIKELRQKFIFINMLLVFLVLIIVFSALCISNYRQARQESQAALQIALNRHDDQRPPAFSVGQKPPEDLVRAPVFVLQISDGSTRLLFADNISVTEHSLQQLAEEVLAAAEDQGLLRDYNLRFLKKNERGGVKAAFIEISGEQAAIKSTLLIASLSLVAALFAFFIISLFLSRWVFKPAELAWQQQRRFVADASHELKTPLTVILANTGILKANRAETVAQLWHWLENTEAEAKRMKQLVDNLLFLAKSDDAKTPVVHTRVNLSDVILSSALAFESVAFDRKVSLNTDALAAEIYIKGDELQLRQLAAILLDNAIKYSEDQGIVTVSLSIRQARALFAVHNSGASLAPEDLEHLFERFYRADKARANEGYGLGLAIANSIAELHRGKISVESDDEQGTVFTVSLPLYHER